MAKRIKPSRKWGEGGRPSDDAGISALEERIEEAGPFPSDGGVIEYSVWGGAGAAWGRSSLRRGDSLVPVTVEGLWYVMAGIRGIADGAWGDKKGSKVVKLARALAGAISEADPGLYDS